jgi:hypothetical protein
MHHVESILRYFALLASAVGLSIWMVVATLPEPAPASAASPEKMVPPKIAAWLERQVERANPRPPYEDKRLTEVSAARAQPKPIHQVVRDLAPARPAPAQAQTLQRRAARPAAAPGPQQVRLTVETLRDYSNN